MSDTPLITGTPAELAVSLYNLISRIGAKQQQEQEKLAAPPEIPDWSGLSWDKQAPWLMLAAKAPARMEVLEGLRLIDVAFEVFRITCTYEDEVDAKRIFFEVMPSQFRVMWESLVRHLHTMMDCDEASFGESEQQWFDWYCKKCEDSPRILLPEGVSA